MRFFADFIGCSAQLAERRSSARRTSGIGAVLRSQRPYGSMIP
jgi:hypothetical protein